MSQKNYTNMSPGASKALWCSGCEAEKGNLLFMVGNEEFKPRESFCHSDYRYLHQRLLSIVS